MRVQDSGTAGQMRTPSRPARCFTIQSLAIAVRAGRFDPKKLSAHTNNMTTMTGGNSLITSATASATAVAIPDDITARYWLGVVCRDHVRRGTGLGIAQLGHGKRTGLARLSPGDWLVYYSPRTSLRDGASLQAFTAIGEVADDEIWQADEGCFQPWRRRVRYAAGAAETPIAGFGRELDLTSGPNWGYRLRRGLVELTPADFARIRAAMIGS